MWKFLLGLLFVQPPDFREEVLKEIRDGPQARLCAKMNEEQREDYVREQATYHAVLWSCKNTGWANTFSRLNLVLLVPTACISGLFGGAIKTAAVVIVHYVTTLI